MQTRISLLSLLTILCLALLAVPAMGQSMPFYTNGGLVPYNSGDNSAPINAGFPGFITDSFNCPFHDCDVTGFTYWALIDQSQGQSAVDTVSWNMGTIPFNFRGGFNGTSTSLQIGDCLPFVGPDYCAALESVSFGTSLDVPGGTNWLTLYGATTSNGNTNPFSVLWGKGADQTSSQLLLFGGDVTNFPPSAAFTMFGTPTNGQTPEPGSILLLGSGMLGVAGILRRKLKL